MSDWDDDERSVRSATADDWRALLAVIHAVHALERSDFPSMLRFCREELRLEDPDTLDDDYIASREMARAKYLVLSAMGGDPRVPEADREESMICATPGCPHITWFGQCSFHDPSKCPRRPDPDQVTR